MPGNWHVRFGQGVVVFHLTFLYKEGRGWGWLSTFIETTRKTLPVLDIPASTAGTGVAWLSSARVVNQNRTRPGGVIPQ